MSPMIYGIIVVAYVLVMLGVGYWCMKRTKTVGDFFLGGRTLGPWMSAFAFGTTYFSAVLFIGYAGKLGWGFGIHTMWIVLGNTLIGTVMSWWLLAGRTREMTARLNAITMPEFLRARFDSKALQILGAVVMFIFLVPYSASVLMGLSYLFEMTFHIDYNTALYFLTALTAVYIVMGGYFAVAVSDFIRGIVEFAGVMIMVALLAGKFGGFGAATSQLTSNPAFAPGLAKVSTFGQGSPLEITIVGVVTLVSLVIITSMGPWSLPQMVQKFYSIRSKADVTRAMIIAGIFSLFMAFGAYYSGALTHLFYGAKLPEELMSPKGPIFDKIMPHFIVNADLPSVLILVIVLMVFSASMSSLSSLVLVSSSAIAVDVYGAFVNREANQKQTMALLRVFCVVFVGSSLFIALQKDQNIVNLMAFSWGALGGIFLGPYLYGLFWKRTTKAAVYVSMLLGLSVSFILYFAWGKDGAPLAGAITMILSLIVVPIVSVMTPPLPKELVEKAFHGAEPEAVETEKATI